MLAELALEPEEELSQLQAMAQAIDGLGGGGASSSTQFVFKGSGLTSRLPSGETSPSSSAAPSAALPSGAASSSTPEGRGSTSHVMDGPPVLLDCSVHEGSSNPNPNPRPDPTLTPTPTLTLTLSRSGWC